MKGKKLNKNRLDKLKTEIKNSDFFKLPKKISEKFLDGSATVWYVNLDGRKHTVVVRLYDEEKPDILKKLNTLLSKY